MTPLPSLQFFGYKLDYCTVPGAIQLCPPGLTLDDCPSHFDCYIPCNASVAFQWFPFPDSPYGGLAYCESFPRSPAYSVALNNTGFQFWAQVGKPVIYMPMYDNIYQAMLSIFVMLTADNWAPNMKQTMVLAGPILSALFTIITMVIGIFAVLNLFLAILLSNLNQVKEAEADGMRPEAEEDIDSRTPEDK